MYQALALKYRPRQFDMMVGQEGVVNTIKGALKSQKLSHAYLFSGLRGSGKTTTARIFAKALICKNGPTDKPCEACEHCVSANEGRNLDIVEMDGASNRKIEDVRNLIENSKYKPLSARFKIYIIDEVHMLTKEAFNALLKTLEEPPEYVKFILATTDPIKVPPTILSRTIHFRFNKIPQKKVVEHLRWVLDSEKITHEDEALEIIARSGDGSIRDTLTLLDQAIVYCKNGVTTDGTAQMLGLIDPAQIAEIFKAIVQKDRTKILKITKDLVDYDAETILTELAEYLKSQFLKNDKTIPVFAMERFMRAIADAKSLFFMGADGSFTLILSLLKMIEAMESESIDELIAKYEAKIGSMPVSNQQISNVSSVQNISQREEKVLASTSVISTESNIELWKRFIAKVYDRNFELGQLLERVLKFECLEGNVLSWSSIANAEEKEQLRRDYGVVLQRLREVFGAEVSVKLIQRSSDIDKEEVTAAANVNNKIVEETGNPNKLIKKDDIELDVLPTGMTIACANSDEELHMVLGIDVTTKSDAEEAENLLQHPLVQKTIELFGVERSEISLHSKSE